jgi:fructuronate reductase
VTRLNLAALRSLRATDHLALPALRSAESSIGIVHLGIGAFHRAHQAVYTEDAALATGDTSWGICGVTQRSAGVRDQLVPQDGLYGVLTKSPTAPTALRITGIIRDVLDGQTQQDELQALLADPKVRVITLTVTEKGYRRGPDGRLDLADPLVRADVDGNPQPASAIGRLARGLQRRARQDAGPVTVLCCDNLNNNGTVVAGLMADFCGALPTAEGDALAQWIGKNVTFPSSMVDRIVPATTDADRLEASGLTGLTDEGLVIAEPFRQWVIEDRFAADRPAWELVGAQITADVTPYELMKLRLLNGSHSTLAYLGALRGYRTIAEAVADPALLGIATALIRTDMIPTLQQPDGVDLVAYGDQVLARYANPDLRHTTIQVAMDGSQKLPQRLLTPILAAVQAGAEPHAATLGVAAWMAFVALGRDTTGQALPLNDPLADRLGEVHGSTDPQRIVDNLLGVTSIFGAELPEIAWWRTELVHDVRDLLAGCIPTLTAEVR